MSSLPPLETIEKSPFNAATPLAALDRAVTPVDQFYVRNHFAVPSLDAATHRLEVGGLVGRALSLSIEDLRGMPTRTLELVMECAGNARTTLDPPVPGVRWNFGAVASARFTGTSLAGVLERAAPQASAREVLFTGADRGNVEPDRVESYERSLTLAQAMDSDALLAWEMNGAPLTPDHGFPLRLVVPNWYGVAAVKWLARIDCRAERFEGHYQTERYVFSQEPGTPEGQPVRLMRVRSLIAHPAEGASLELGPCEISGNAWSGESAIRRVEVSTDVGGSWRDAQLEHSPSPYGATLWRIGWMPLKPGRYRILARATDGAGNVQPLAPVWNRWGYGNNAAHAVSVDVA